MNLRRLEMELERLEGFERPTPRLEQYGTPAPVAARLLHHAAMQGAIEGRRVVDLGCGTGILGCGAALLGAAYPYLSRPFGLPPLPGAPRTPNTPREAAPASR